jgi:drug/metabolite transporter (DMT)-like permease
MRKHRLFPILTVLFAVFVWGISFVSTKVVLKELPPVSIAFIRQLIAILPLLLVLRISGDSLRITKREIPLFFVAAFFGLVLYFVFENTGLQYTSASNAAMLVAAIPVFTLIIESVIGHRRLPVFTLAMVLVSIGGVYLVLFENGMPDFSSKTFFGNMLVFGAMVSWIAYTYISKSLGRKYSSLKITTIQTLCSIPLFFPFLLREIPAWKVPSNSVLIQIAFLGIFCSAGAYVAFLYGLQKLGPILPSAFLNLLPVVTILTGMVMLAEVPSWSQVAGASLIIGSLTALTVKGRRTAVREIAVSSAPK